MKKRMLKIATIATAAVALVVVTVLVTVAYLTSSSAVSNTFTVGNVFVHMYESKVDEKGVKLNDDSNINGSMKDSDGNSYHLLPGETYDKDPTIYITENSDECYLFVKIRNNIELIEEGNFVSSDGTENAVVENLTIAQQMEKNGWKEFVNTSTGKVYVYVGTGVGDDGETVYEAKPIEKKPTMQSFNVFETFSVHKDADVSLYGGAKVTLTAFAIQTAGFDTDSEGTATQKAWNAIVETYPYESGATISE